jgi:hypothetical protein
MTEQKLEDLARGPEDIAPASKPAPLVPQAGPTAAAGTLARDANEVKATPAGWIRERVHIGDGHFKWSEPFDPVARAAETAEVEAEKMKHRTSHRRVQDKIDADNAAAETAKLAASTPEKK